MRFFGFGKKGKEDKEKENEKEAVRENGGKIKEKFKRAANNPKSLFSNSSNNLPSSTGQGEHDLVWEGSLPGFRGIDRGIEEDISPPKADSEELDKLALDAGLAFPKEEKEENDVIRSSPLETSEEGMSLPEFPQQRASEVANPEKVAKESKPISLPQRNKLLISPSKVHIRDNNLFIASDSYERFYSVLRDMDSDIIYLEKQHLEIMNSQDKIKKETSNFIKEIRDMISIALESEDIIREGGESNE